MLRVILHLVGGNAELRASVAVQHAALQHALDGLPFPLVEQLAGGFENPEHARGIIAAALDVEGESIGRRRMALEQVRALAPETPPDDFQGLIVERVGEDVDAVERRALDPLLDPVRQGNPLREAAGQMDFLLPAALSRPLQHQQVDGGGPIQGLGRIIDTGGRAGRAARAGARAGLLLGNRSLISRSPSARMISLVRKGSPIRQARSFDAFFGSKRFARNRSR